MNYQELQELIRTKESLIELLQDNYERGKGDRELLIRELQEIIHWEEYKLEVLNDLDTLLQADYESLNPKFKEIENLLDNNPPPDVRNVLLAALVKVHLNQSKITQELQKNLMEYKLALLGHKHYSDLLDIMKGK